MKEFKKGTEKKVSETTQILHAPFTITPTHLIIPDIAQELYYTTEIILKRAQNSETLVTPQSTLGLGAPMCFLQARVTDTLDKRILFQTYKNQ